MTREDIIRMAREAGIPDDNIPALAWGRLETGKELLERFAALVVAAEREACAKVCEEHPEGLNMFGGHFVLCAQAIRARSNK